MKKNIPAKPQKIKKDLNQKITEALNRGTFLHRDMMDESIEMDAYGANEYFGGIHDQRNRGV